MAKRGEKVFAGGTWTSARYFGFIRSGLRRMSARWPVKYQVMEEARRKYTGPDKRTKWEYQCNHCNQWFKTKDIQVDHIVPAGSLKTFEDLPRFVETLFCERGNLQVLCTECHNVKTQEERNAKN
jgi:5-methylcytosine-specific restriction endonuclease McrA